MNETQSSGIETDNNEDTKSPSDTRIILGPLVKYAAIGLVLVSVIITTAIMLDHHLNDIDREIAELEAELAAANPATENNKTVTEKSQLETASVTATNEKQVSVADPQQPVTEVAQAAPTVTAAAVAKNVNESSAVTAVEATDLQDKATSEQVVTDEATAVEQATENDSLFARQDEYFDKSIEKIIKERNAYLKERDRVYLEEFRASQEKQLQLMRERLARQEKRIEEMEKRHQERYDIRAANVKEMQEMRENFMSDRI